MKVPVKTLYASYLPKVKDRNKILMADSGLLVNSGLPPKRKSLLSSIPDEYLDNLDNMGKSSNPNDTGINSSNFQSPNVNPTLRSGDPRQFNNNGLGPDTSNFNIDVAGGAPPLGNPMALNLNPPPPQKQPYQGQIGQAIVAGASAFDALLPYGHIRRWPNVRPNVSPNQHPYGTGSQALMEYGGNLPERANSGIHIKPSHKGRFTAYKKRTGQTTAEALHSKNPHVREMANFARNAKKWHHKEDGGGLMNGLMEMPVGGVVGTPGITPALSSPAGLSGSMYGRVPSHVNAGPTKVKHTKLKFPDGGVIPPKKNKLVAHADSQRFTTPQPYGNRYVAFPYGQSGTIPTTTTVDLQSKSRVPSPNERGYVNAYNTVDEHGNPLSLTDEQIPYKYLTGKNTNNFAITDAYNPNIRDSVYVAPGVNQFGVHKPMAYGGILEEAKSGWLSHAVNPAHKGYCTPMTKATCTPRRKAFAKRAKAHNLAEGGPVGDGPVTYPASHLGQQLKKGKWHYPPTGESPKKFKSGGSLTASKAAEILHDGTAQGHPLTDKQRRFFGWKSHQAPNGTSIPGDPYHFTTASKPSGGVPPYTPSDRQDAYLVDQMNQVLTTGQRPSNTNHYSTPEEQQMLNDAYMWKTVNGQHTTGQQSIQGYFNRPVDPNNPLSMRRAKLNSIGYGAGAMYNTTPNLDVRNPPPAAGYTTMNTPKPTMEHGGMMSLNDHMWNTFHSGGHLMDTSVWTYGGNTDHYNKPLNKKGFIDQYGHGNYGGLYEDGGYAAYGGGYADGGVIDTHWGGNAAPIAYNPYDGGTTQFNGPSHADGGIGMSYNGNQVEVEGGETAAKDQNGDLNVFGNMYVPGTKTKFKTAVKEIAEKEKHFDTLKTNGTNTVNSLDPANRYEQIKFNAAELMMKGGDAGQKELAQRKQQLADLQNSMLDTAREHNLDPQGMSQGNLKKAKKGMWIGGQTNMSSLSNKIKKAPFGITIPTNSIYNSDSNTDPGDSVNSPTRSDRNNNPGNIKYGKYAKAQGATGQDKDGFAVFPDPTLGHTAMYNLLTGDSYKNLPVKSAITKWTGGKPYDLSGLGDLNGKKIGDLAPNELSHLIDYMRHGEGTSYGTTRTPDTPLASTPPTKISINPTTPIGLPSAPAFSTPTPETKPATPTQPTYSLGPTSPKRDIPTQAKPLGFNDVASDIFDIATNHERPVYGQKFIPQLYQPYQVSFQDRINQNQESFNDIKRLVNPANPAALGSLAAQKYTSDNAVRADEFRTNQGISNQVYNENVGLTNNAQLENLRLADTQYTRQEGANAKTREMNQMIVNDISDKYNAVKMRNNELRAYENLYNYRLQENPKTGGLDETNYNPDQNFEFLNRNSPSTSADNRRTTVYNPNGTVRNYRDTKDADVVNQYRELRNEMMKRKLDPNNPDNIKMLKGGKLALLSAPKLFRGGYIKQI